MKQYIKYYFFILLAGALMVSCSKMDESYSEFLKDGERLYTGRPDSLLVSPGKGRLKVSWKLPADPKITTIKLLWNKGIDSLIIPVNKTGVKMEQIIPDLPEGIYSFEMKAYDKDGNPSIKSEAIGEVFGANYQSIITNRPVQKAIHRIVENAITHAVISEDAYVQWFGASGQVSEVAVEYTDKTNAKRVRKIRQIPNPINPERSTIWADTTRLTGYKENSVIRWRTSYLPTPLSIDTFFTAWNEVIAEKVFVDPNFEEPITFPNEYRLIAKHSNKPLVIKTANNSNNTEVVQKAVPATDLTSVWIVKQIPGENNTTNNTITNKYNGAKDMAVSGGSVDDGAKIIQYTKAANGTNDTWIIKSANVNNTHYYILNLKSGKAITVTGAGTGDNVNAVQMPYTGADNQLFKFVLIAP
ncbi:hypothetical protein ABIE26_002210 [Pedobacter africanus]|uniref:Uncharacterized protein n=1 Tax=Pedobacter africanus TaxID=151894 RepID=A0ACC6KYV2_9SPHI|nr:DUF4998 domain-containing protein [Pedobacter africanus]MDR6784401.1 hypothetical protein [Pedobacter africanus]